MGNSKLTNDVFQMKSCTFFAVSAVSGSTSTHGEIVESYKEELALTFPWEKGPINSPHGKGHRDV